MARQRPRRTMRIAELTRLVDEAEAIGYVPGPTERERLRRAACLTIAACAGAIDVTTLTFRQWETGAWQPRLDDHEDRYRRLLTVTTRLAHAQDKWGKALADAS